MNINRVGKLKSTFEKYYPFFVILFLLLSTHLYWILNNQALMIFYGDSYQEMLHLYLGGWEKFHSLNFNLWSWSLGLGGPYFAYDFYFASSPFFLLSLLFPKEWIPHVLLYLNILKLALLYYFSYRWLLYRFLKKQVAVIGSVIITFSGWVIFYYHYNFFIDAFMFYPLILVGVERFLKEGKTHHLFISMALLAWTSFYFLYMFIPFLVIYVLMRLYELNQTYAWNKRKVLEGMKWVLLGIAASGVVLFPSFYAVLNSPRLMDSSLSEMLKPMTWLNIFRYVSTLFSPVVKRFDPSAFISTSIDPGYGWSGGVSLYSFAMVPALLPLLIKTSKRFIQSYLVAFIGLMILALFPLFNRLLQGTLDVRWFYVFLLLNVIALSEILSKSPKYTTVYPFLFSYLFLGLLAFISLKFGLYGSLEQRHFLLQMILGIAIFMFLYQWLYSKNHTVLLILVLILEALFSFFIPMMQDGPMDASTFNHYISDTFNDRAEKELLETDSGFYRMVVDSADYTSQNRPAAVGYPGTSFYSSVYSYYLDPYYQHFSDTYSVPPVFGREANLNQLSVKYYLSSTQNHPVPLGFKWLKTMDKTDVYVNENYLPLGYAVSQQLSLSCLESLPVDVQDRLMLTYQINATSTSCEYSDFLSYSLYATEIHDTYYWYKESGFSDTQIMVRGQDLNHVTVTYAYQGNFIRTDSYSQPYYVSFLIPHDEKVDALTITVDSKYSIPNYELLYHKDMDVYTRWYEESQAYAFYDVVNSNDTITAMINTDDTHSFVSTSIPYDPDWNVKVDGKPITIENVNEGFIGFTLKPGVHQVQFSYQPKAFYIGLGISILSLSTFIWIQVRKHHPL